MAHHTELTDKSCLVNVFDEITDSELSEINNELYSSPCFDKIKYCIRDLTRVTKQNLTYEALTYAAYINASSNAYKKNLKVAFVVSELETTKRVLHYLEESKNAGSTWHQEIFFDLASAEQWASPE